MLSAFSRTLTVAIASRSFLGETPPERLSRWKTDEKRFLALRAHVKTRYADAVDWSDYEKRVRALLDAHVTAHQVITVVEPLAVFDDAAIEAARRDKQRSDASIADFDEVMRSGGPAIDPGVIDAVTDEILASARVRMADDGRSR